MSMPSTPWPRRTCTDPLLFVRLEPDGDELGQRGAVVVEDPEGAVPGVGHRAGLVDDVAQQGGQLEIGLEEQRGLEDAGAAWRDPRSSDTARSPPAIEAARVQLQVVCTQRVLPGRIRGSHGTGPVTAEPVCRRCVELLTEPF